jgi:RNA polymerase sigma-70 factor, ECF subfamily
MVAVRQVVNPQADDTELVRRARSGEMSAFRSLYVEHFPVVSRMAKRLGTPASELDDVTQEVFAKAFRSLDKFRGGNFGFWIHRICANVVTDHHRRRNVRETLGRLWGREAKSQAEAPEPETNPVEPQAFIGKVLAHMKPKHREVFVLFEVEGIPGEEIAERMGCPLNTVWTRLFHARKEFARIGRRYMNFEDPDLTEAGGAS